MLYDKTARKKNVALLLVAPVTGCVTSPALALAITTMSPPSPIATFSGRVRDWIPKSLEYNKDIHLTTRFFFSSGNLKACGTEVGALISGSSGPVLMPGYTVLCS